MNRNELAMKGTALLFKIQNHQGGLNMKTKSRILLTVSFVAVIAIVVVMICLNAFAVPASATEYMKKTAVQRLEHAENRYAELRANPEGKTEVLISFKDVSLSELHALLPQNCDVSVVYHYYTNGTKTVTGAYLRGQGKSIKEIQAAYYSEIHNMLVSNIEACEEEIQNYYKLYMLDHSLTEAQFNTMKIDPAWTNENETISELEERIEFQKEHLRQLKQGNFDLRGIRITASNADIVKMLESNNVLMVEILDFDNNNIVVPVINR